MLKNCLLVFDRFWLVTVRGRAGFPMDNGQERRQLQLACPLSEG